ncbi:ANKRD12 protein [Capsaspora owczarzaki ATCC 30864]|uniref:ANKRD12 protein n=1 Tax=Capsaspora owczarzaki (strain ATCC 30864) TaxID=595528 RepID=A0A0D2WKD4_CAPO3|nr:ANKRD12 protein [Capsaspora owczarzaki ATCC 30864]KJE90690.1 ANKRD12 protein [Capsaspora owczarzaki ATCC 30864]|eukprot:XP_004364827.1 ANKRD12 protein [Capsaspora owczarzaki ATCC 30864]
MSLRKLASALQQPEYLSSPSTPSAHPPKASSTSAVAHTPSHAQIPSGGPASPATPQTRSLGGIGGSGHFVMLTPPNTRGSSTSSPVHHKQHAALLQSPDRRATREIDEPNRKRRLDFKQTEAAHESEQDAPESADEDQASDSADEATSNPISTTQKQSSRRRSAPSSPVKPIATKPTAAAAAAAPASSVAAAAGGPTLTERQLIALQKKQEREAARRPTQSMDKINGRNERGETPLHVAAIRNNVNAAKRLIQQGAVINATDNAGWTPLHEACNHGRIAIVRLLLEHHADATAPGLNNDTPLHDAAMNNHIQVAAALMQYGASAYAVNANGATPVDVAATPEMKRLLQGIAIPEVLQEADASTEDESQAESKDDSQAESKVARKAERRGDSKVEDDKQPQPQRKPAKQQDAQASRQAEPSESDAPSEPQETKAKPEARRPAPTRAPKAATKPAAATSTTGRKGSTRVLSTDAMNAESEVKNSDSDASTSTADAPMQVDRVESAFSAVIPFAEDSSQDGVDVGRSSRGTSPEPTQASNAFYNQPSPVSCDPVSDDAYSTVTAPALPSTSRLVLRGRRSTTAAASRAGRGRSQTETSMHADAMNVYMPASPPPSSPPSQTGEHEICEPAARPTIESGLISAVARSHVSTAAATNVPARPKRLASAAEIGWMTPTDPQSRKERFLNVDFGMGKKPSTPPPNYLGFKTVTHAYEVPLADPVLHAALRAKEAAIALREMAGKATQSCRTTSSALPTFLSVPAWLSSIPSTDSALFMQQEVERRDSKIRQNFERERLVLAAENRVIEAFSTLAGCKNQTALSQTLHRLASDFERTKQELLSRHRLENDVVYALQRTAWSEKCTSHEMRLRLRECVPEVQVSDFSLDHIFQQAAQAPQVV